MILLEYSYISSISQMNDVKGSLTLSSSSTMKKGKPGTLKPLRSVSMGSLTSVPSLGSTHYSHDSYQTHKKWLETKYDEKSCTIPKRVLFSDLAMHHPIIKLNVKGWTLNQLFFETIQHECHMISHLTLDYCYGVTLERFSLIRGLKKLKKLSLCGIIDCVITKSFAEIIASFPSLIYLNLSETTTDVTVFKTFSTTCASLKNIVLDQCKGLDDFGLYALSQMVMRFRTLEKISLNNNSDFADVGLLDFIVNSCNILQSLSVAHCKHVSSLCLVGLRSKMAVLNTLNIDSLSCTLSAYEWVTEGCRHVTHLNLANSTELDDATITLIGRKCRFLDYLDISKCMLISDIGIKGFFKRFLGNLSVFDMSGCILCGGASAIAVSTNCKELCNIKLNGLSRISCESVVTLFNKATKLNQFEMCCELSTTILHRTSMLPHFNDTVFLNSQYASMRIIKLAGACMITDKGIAELVKQCANTLQVLDVSYCNLLTNASFIAIANNCKRIESMIFTGCGKINDAGLTALSNSTPCIKSLTRLDINGCVYVTDEGMIQLAKLRNLEHLGIRSCDQINDGSIIAIAKGCPNLRSLDMLNLDLVTVAAVHALVHLCSHLTSLNCESCSMTAKEYSAAVKNVLPFAQPVIGKCRLQLSHSTVIQYNKHILALREKNKYAYVLQRFCRYINATKMRRFVLNLKREKLNELRRIFHAMRAEIKRSSKEKRGVDLQYNARRLQYHMRKLSGIRHAILKVRKLRKEDQARRLLQRVYRGHMARKRYRKRFLDLYLVYNQFGRMVHRYWVMCAARKLHQQILAVQGWGLMVPRRQEYLCMRRGWILMQKRWKRYLKWKYDSNIEARRQIALRMWNEKRDKAIRLMQRNWKNCFFNKSMSGFILTCCIWYRSDYDEKRWNSTVMQRYWRGYMVRLKNYRREAEAKLRQVSATKIQAVARRRRIQPQYEPWRNYMRHIWFSWKKFIVYSKPRLRVGKIVKVLQKYARHFLFRNKRYYAAVHIQRIFRGYYYRKKWAFLIYHVKYRMVNAIKRAFRVYKARKALKLIKARRHMASYKIIMLVLKTFEVQRMIKRKHEEEAAARRELNKLKKELNVKKRDRMVERVRRNRLALRIQQAWRRYQAACKAAVKDNTSVSGMDSLDDSSVATAVVKQGNIGGGIDFNPIRAIGNVIDGIGSFFKEKELIHPKDQGKFVNAVLKYQVRSILQEGVVDLHLTLGELEMKGFEHTQNNLKQAQLPYFIRLEQDLSGPLQLLMYLWVLMGTGTECICRMVFQDKPEGTSISGMKIRREALYQEGVKLVYHQHISFEIQGIQSVKQGKGDYAIQDIKIVTEQEEADKLEDEGKYSLCCNLNKFGMHTQIWTTARRPVDEENLYKLGRLPAYDWFDDKLLRLVKGFNLSEADVYAMRKVFEKLQTSRHHGDVILVEKLFECIKFPYNQMCQWIVQSLKPVHKKRLGFSEYVHLICYYTMLSSSDLVKFLFSCQDDENKFYIRRDQFNNLLDIMAEESPYNVAIWKGEYENYRDKKLKFMFISGFREFVGNNGGVLWRAQLLQQKLMKLNIGIEYWEKKMEQYRVTRERLDIRQMPEVITNVGLSGSTPSLSAVIVGGGQVGLTVAAQLKKRGFIVEVFEKENDPRNHGHDLVCGDFLDSIKSDCSISPNDDCIGRLEYWQTLLTKAEDIGIQLNFGHECCKVDTERGLAKFILDNQLIEARGDLLVGADGADSIVRFHLRKYGPSFIHQGNTVLVGDAASSDSEGGGMDDVSLLMSALDSQLLVIKQHDTNVRDVIEQSLMIYSKTRLDYCKKMTLLSNAGDDKTLKYHNPNSLQLTSEQLQNLFDLTTKLIVNHQSDLAAGNLPPRTSIFAGTNAPSYQAGHDVSAKLRELEPPLTGVTDIEAFLTDMLESIREGVHLSHPGFMSKCPSAGMMQGLIGLLLGRSFNRMPSVWSESPALVQIETNVIKWFCHWMGYSGDCYGYLTTGGSISNLMAVMCAVRRHRGDYYATTQDEAFSFQTREVVYVSAQSHFSNKKAVRLAGFEQHNLRIIKVRSDFTMDIDDLRARIVEDKQQGLSPFCVIGTAGTTNTGAIDDFNGLADIAQEFNLWCHCDAAFGGFFNLTERGRAALRGIERADSITVDAHKSLFMPMGCSAVLVKDRADLRNTFEITSCAVYISGFTQREDQPDLLQYGPELTRDFRGLTLYLPLKMHGIKVFEENLNKMMDLVLYLYRQLSEIQEIECIQMHSLVLPVVNFRCKATTLQDSSLLSVKLAELISAKNHVFLTTTELPNHGNVVRVCILNHLTEWHHVEQLLVDIRMSVKELLHS